MYVFMVVRVSGQLYPYASLWACSVFAWRCTYVGVGDSVHMSGVRVGEGTVYVSVSSYVESMLWAQVVLV